MFLKIPSGKPIARSFHSVADNGEKGSESKRSGKRRGVKSDFSFTDSLGGMGDRCSRESRKGKDGKDSEDGKEVS